MDEALGCEFTVAESSFGIYKVAKVLMKICDMAMGHVKLVDNGDVDIRSSPGTNGVNYCYARVNSIYMYIIKTPYRMNA